MAKFVGALYRGNRWSGQKPHIWVPGGKWSYDLLTGDRRLVISTWPFRGACVIACYTKTWRYGERDGDLLYRCGRLSVKKVKVSDRSTVRHLVAVESEVFKDMMPLVEFICMLMYDDGSPRQPGYVGMWSNGSAWFARATDKDADATLTAEGRTLDEALGLLSLHLGADDAPWVKNPGKRKKGG